jgi:four helix bundle protein
MKDFRNLKVWEKAHSLTLDIYLKTKEFPRSEMFALTSQIRRAATSIPTNISEGCGRSNGKDFARFLQIAMGSASELVYLVFLSKVLEFIEEVTFTDLIMKITEIKKMLTSLMKKVRAEN